MTPSAQLPSVAIARAGSAARSFVVIGRLIDDGRDLGEGRVFVDDAGRIAALETTSASPAMPTPSTGLPPRQFHAPIVSPGFIDLQVNGAFGFEVGDDPAALAALARRLPEAGVTAFLPTLVSRREAAYAPALAAFAAATAQARQAPHEQAASPSPQVKAQLLGLHLEGPLLSVRRAGAHDREAIAAATAASVTRLLGLAERQGARVRMLTLAPECDGALPLISALETAGVHVSLGHTDATFELAQSAIDAGARLGTHVFNAMPPLHHRDPGAVGAILSDDRVTALFIADGVHVHPAVLKLAMRAKPPQRRAVVSDAIRDAGTLATSSALAGRDVIIDASSARLPDGTLAGATLTLDRAVRNAASLGALPLAEALRMATAVPAAAVAARGHGRLVVGAPANLVLLDDELQVLATFVEGQVAFARGGDVDAFRA